MSKSCVLYAIPDDIHIFCIFRPKNNLPNNSAFMICIDWKFYEA